MCKVSKRLCVQAYSFKLNNRVNLSKIFQGLIPSFRTCWPSPERLSVHHKDSQLTKLLPLILQELYAFTICYLLFKSACRTTSPPTTSLPNTTATTTMRPYTVRTRKPSTTVSSTTIRSTTQTTARTTVKTKPRKCNHFSQL